MGGKFLVFRFKHWPPSSINELQQKEKNSVFLISRIYSHFKFHAIPTVNSKVLTVLPKELHPDTF